jgi:hypothetical protein
LTGRVIAGVLRFRREVVRVSYRHAGLALAPRPDRQLDRLLDVLLLDGALAALQVVVPATGDVVLIVE